MSVNRFLMATFFTLSLASATVFADTTNQNSSATGAPDNSSTATAPANGTNANSSNNLVSDHTQATTKKLQIVNINTADAKTLEQSLHGIGPKRAAAIIAYRTQNGPFKTIDDLSKIKGISQKVIGENRDRITLS